MGSFNMNASFSKMPIYDKTTVVICLKRKYEGNVSLLPITYPIVGQYWDYGEVHDFEENEITKAICDFFEIDNMNDVIKFIYDMTIHGDYEDAINDIKKGKESYYKDKYHKYVGILDKLRKNSGIVVKSEDDIINDCLNRYKKYNIENNLSKENVDKINDFFIKSELERNKNLSEMLDSYELALFYENTPVFDALCSKPFVDENCEPIDDCWAESTGDVSKWGEYIVDKNNLFFITKNCNSPETIEIKKGLQRLYNNFRIESKIFKFEETTIMGQEDCPYMWYRYGKAIHEMLRKNINQYRRNIDIDDVENKKNL